MELNVFLESKESAIQAVKKRKNLKKRWVSILRTWMMASQQGKSQVSGGKGGGKGMVTLF